jgi:hypothetical protein
MGKQDPHRAATALKERARTAISETWRSQANLSLFLALVVFVSFVLPLLGFVGTDLKLYSDAAFSLLLVSGIAIAWGSTKLFMFAASIGGVALAIRWIAWFMPTATLELWSESWTLLAIVVIVLVLLSQIFRAGRVRSARVQGAVAVYLLFGVGWAHAYHIAAMRVPGSFVSTNGAMTNVSDWIYYSLVTLTTVGYGDIVPAHRVTRILAVGEAVAGQLYLAVLIARLVAMEVVSWQSTTDQNP